MDEEAAMIGEPLWEGAEAAEPEESRPSRANSSADGSTLEESPVMAFQPEQVEQFRAHGYLAVPAFFSAREVAAMRAELERLKREGFLRNVATDGDGKTTSRSIANLQLCPMYQKSDLFRALPFDPKVVEAVRQLIGDPVLLHLDQVFLKPRKHGSGTSWHQGKP
jgi:Phytanoyl-CoA dioxygenase (PhyH)